ncbi:MAG: thymidylate kinase, partial [Sphingomonas sp.]
MSFLLAIEGADGAGKATASALVVEQLHAAGRTADVVSFPRYIETVGGWALGAMLAGTLPRGTSPKAANDVVVFDRYIASNMAYQAAQVPADEADAMMA